MAFGDYRTTRREFLRNIPYGLALLNSIYNRGEVLAAPQTLTIVSSTLLPSTVRPVNIDQIVNDIASNVPVGKGNYISGFIDLVQFIHHKLAGKTYAQHIEEYGKKVLGFGNPTEVVIIRGLERVRGDSGKFAHAAEGGKRNTAFIDADLPPAASLITLNHELVHGISGSGELLPHAHTHRDIAYMVTLFPQLLRDRNEECPLYGIMYNTFRSEEGIWYATLLSGEVYVSGALQKDISVEKALELIIKDQQKVIIQIVLQGRALLDKYGGEQLTQRLKKTFTDRTRQYILQQNPKLPLDKRRLLERKLQEILKI